MKLRSCFTFLKTNWSLCTTLIIVASYGLVLFYIRKDSLWPDGVSYIRIAEHYASFNFKEAINGYWAPLTSWLMVPLIWIGVQPLYAFWLINFLATLSILCFVYWLLRQVLPKIGQVPYFLTLTALGITFMEWSMIDGQHPDALSGYMLLLVLFYFHKLIKHTTYSHAILLGICLAGLYFSKSIGLYVGLFVLAYVSFKTIFSKVIPRKFSAVMIFTFLSLTIPWIVLISLKYNHLTISTAASYNMRLIGPAQPGHPHVKESAVLEVKHTDDTWAWDDPSYMTLEEWKPSDHKIYYSALILRTLLQISKSFISISPLLLISLFVIVYKCKESQINTILIAITLLVCAAYSITIFEDRYLYIVAIPLIVFGIAQIPKSIWIQRTFLYVVLALSMIFASLQIVPTILNAEQKMYTDSNLKIQSIRAMSYIPKHSVVAGPVERYRTCYFAHLSCTGLFVLNDGDSVANGAKIETMRSAKIQYYFDYSLPKNLGLQVVYSTESTEQSCYDYVRDQHGECPRQYLTIYKL